MVLSSHLDNGIYDSTTRIISNDFMMIDEDHCVYTKRDKDKFIILSLYVDDILIAGNDKEFFERHQRMVII